MSSQDNLKEELLKLSEATRWNAAKLEWAIDEIYWEDTPDTCLCGKFPIKELCFLRNVRNGHRALVGNVCVKRFLGLQSGSLFDGIKRISEDPEKALNAAAVDHAFSKGWINDWEFGFCTDTVRKRKLSFSQMQKRIQINNKVLAKVRNARGSLGV